MHTIQGAIRRALLSTLTVFLVAFAAIFAFNQVMLAHEEALMEHPLGTMVEVDGRHMCVQVRGEGEHTLVFLSGSGTASPILDFKTLGDLLCGGYRIVVIEKFGYGFSDVVDTERSFSTILRQDREALAKLDIAGPYVLVPHSMSGLEAILWAQEHPEEVEAIVGLDMCIPRAYDGFDLEGTLRTERLAALGRQLGIVRLFYGDASLPAGLTREERSLYRAIASRIAVNNAVINEGLAIPGACARIDVGGKPDIPMLMFVSDGSEVWVDGWARLQHEYAAGLSQAMVVELDCGHYVHNHEPELIAAQIRAFLEEQGPSSRG